MLQMNNIMVEFNRKKSKHDLLFFAKLLVCVLIVLSNYFFYEIKQLSYNLNIKTFQYYINQNIQFLYNNLIIFNFEFIYILYFLFFDLFLFCLYVVIINIKQRKLLSFNIFKNISIKKNLGEGQLCLNFKSLNLNSKLLC